MGENRSPVTTSLRRCGRPYGIECQAGRRCNSNLRPSELEYQRIAVDTSKRVFTLHGIDAAGAVVLRRDLRRGEFEAFFAKQAACEVVLVVCGTSHHWGRPLMSLGHRVRLLPPQYVKPSVKRGENGRLPQ